MQNKIRLLLRKIKSAYVSVNEYICINGTEILPGIKVLFNCESTTTDVTNCHMLLGYAPLTIGIPTQHLINNQKSGTLQFLTNNKLCGTIFLLQSKIIHPSLTIFIGIKASHTLLTPLEAIVQNLLRLRADTKQTLYPSKNEYDQIRVAYSFPRTISVLIVQKDGLYNVFPTDLHGSIDGQNQYVISLRENGNALKQIKAASTVTLAHVRSKVFNEVYRLGKNHMGEMKPAAEFKILTQSVNEMSRLILPDSCTAYLQLKFLQETKSGIHHLLTFSFDQYNQISEDSDKLAHIHSYYSSWRKRHHFNDHLLIRQVQPEID